MAHPINHLLGQGNKMNYVLSHADSTYDMRMALPTNTARHPANQYLLLDSADRLAITKSSIVSVPTATLNGVDLQPWNDFQMQRPQSLMEAFAKRIAVAEVRMPWYVPNVNSYNNGFSITTKNSSGSLNTTMITVPVGFYTPSSLVTTVQALLTTNSSGGIFKDAFTFSYNAATYQYSLVMNTNAGGTNYAVLGYSNVQTSSSWLSNYDNWLSQANFFNLVGWPFSFSNLQLFSTAYTSSNPLTGSPSETLYTEFIDITSSKAHEYTNLRDGNSGNTSTVSICRLYINDNVNVNENPWIGQAPVVLHRQFKNPKYIRWNAEAVVSWLDIQVRDSFGNLVPLPPSTTLPTNPATTYANTYPDFCITLLASED
jgi:hypothetical protein